MIEKKPQNLFRIHIFVSGLVQGVFFRARTRDKAGSLGVAGWVRNLRDGRVEIVAEGAKDKLEDLLKWCHKGPSGAVVSDVNADWEPATGEFVSFDIT